MKWTPILYTGAMVRAILNDQKLMTRRMVKPQPFSNNTYHRGDVQASECAMRSTGDPVCFNFGVTAVDGEGGLIEWRECPYGCPGDRLWVREAWAFLGLDMMRHGRTHSTEDAVIEYADKVSRTVNIPWQEGEKWFARKSGGKPSIHMPRWASRITLEITSVRVERLNDISERDATAEGMGSPILRDCKVPKFMALWEQINGPGSWDANPWVWVIEFRRVMQ